MPLYLADKKATLFKGEHKPVSLYLGDKKVAGYKYESAAGEHVSFDGTYDDTASVIISGKSEQVQTEQGKNLFDPTSRTIVSGDAQLSLNLSTILIVGQTYTLSANEAIFFKIAPLFGWLGSDSLVNTVAQSVTFTWRKRADEMEEYLYTSDSNFQSLSNEDCIAYQIHFELGDTATEYEPFTPDSPSPDYPSPINSVEPFDLVSARNLFNKKQLSITDANLSSGNVVRPDANFDVSEYIPLKPISYYKAEFGASGTILYDKNKEFVRAVLVDGGTLTPLSTEKYARLNVMKSYLDRAILAPVEQLRAIHIPYALGGLPSGEKDIIRINHVEETAELILNTWEHTFTDKTSWLVGTDNANLHRPNFRMYTTLPKISPNVYDMNNILCDISKAGSYTGKEGLQMIFNTSGVSILYLFLSKKRVGWTEETTPENAPELINLFVNYLRSNPPTIRFPLATPETISLDYNEVKTYYDHTQIYTTGSDIKPELDVTVRVIDKEE